MIVRRLTELELNVLRPAAAELATAESALRAAQASIQRLGALVAMGEDGLVVDLEEGVLRRVALEAPPELGGRIELAEAEEG